MSTKYKNFCDCRNDKSDIFFYGIMMTKLAYENLNNFIIEIVIIKWNNLRILLKMINVN